MPNEPGWRCEYLTRAATVLIFSHVPDTTGRYPRVLPRTTKPGSSLETDSRLLPRKKEEEKKFSSAPRLSRSAAATMASSPLLLFLFSLISLSLIAANARPGPCDTLFISFTVSSSSRPPFRFSYTSDPQKSSELFTIFHDVDDSNPQTFLPSSGHFLEHPEFPQFLPFDEAANRPRQLETAAPLFPFAGLSASSVRDRTKDILSVVLALLFGVSCGALTAATMYLAWSVIMSAYDAGDSDGEDEADDVSGKTNNDGYVKIPGAADSAVPAGKGYEEN